MTARTIGVTGGCETMTKTTKGDDKALHIKLSNRA